MANMKIRPPAVSGLFYSDNAARLRSEIVSLFEKNRSRPVAGSLRGVIAPHAGYIYSGDIAAAAYGQLQGRTFSTIVILSPSHREYFKGLSIYDGDFYATPLGEIPVNAALRQAFLARAEHGLESVKGHRDEHAIEVQLPFLQVALGSFSILPIVIGDQHRPFCQEAADALSGILSAENALLVASTDLSHYHTALEAKALDDVTIQDIVNFDPDGLQRDLESGEAEACGGGPVVVALKVLKMLGATTVTLAARAHSGDVSGDYESVVGYMSAIAA